MSPAPELVESTATNDDVTLAVFATPNDSAERVVIAIHGGPGFTHNYLRGLAAVGGESIRFATYDQRAMGGSTAPATTSYTLDQYVADLEAVRASLDVDHVTLLGHSWGGLIAMAYAVAHPDRVDRLLLVSSIPPTWPGLAAANERFNLRIIERVESGHVPLVIPDPVGPDCGDQIRALAPVYFADPDKTWLSNWAEGTECNIAVRRLTGESIGEYDLTASLASLTIPVLVLFGDGDPFGVAMAQHTYDALESAQRMLLFLPNCGHFPWIECPDSFNPIVSRFLQQ